MTDAPIDAGRREGDAISAHLRNSLVLDGLVLAAAGAHAQLVVGGVTSPDGKRHPVVLLDRFSTTAGLMPVRLVESIVPPIPSGTEIEARTLAEVDHIGDRLSIRIPFPFALTGDRPASAYTPTPARTASPRMMMKPEPKASPSPTPSAAPLPATPDPAVTKIPGK